MSGDQAELPGTRDGLGPVGGAELAQDVARSPAGFLADPGFRHQAAEATGLPEAALEASAVADPHVTVKADVDRLLTSPLLTPKVSVSGHVYDIATGGITTILDAQRPQGPRP